MAGMAGFEPAVHWIKTRCLTAWLHPIMLLHSHLDNSICVNDTLSPLATQAFTLLGN